MSAAQGAAPIPSFLITPGKVDSRIGTLEFNDGMPSPGTLAKVYDNVDFTRAFEASRSHPRPGDFLLSQDVDATGSAHYDRLHDPRCGGPVRFRASYLGRKDNRGRTAQPANNVDGS